MHLTITLANEALHKTIWYPTILGALAVIAGVILFSAPCTCCSAPTSVPGSGS